MKKSIQAHAYSIPADMMTAIQQVEALIAKRKSIDAKIETSKADAETAEGPHRSALDAQAQADATLAMSLTEADNVKNEKAADAAASLVDETLRAKTRLERTTEALCKMATETDKEIVDAGVTVNLELNIFSQEATEAFSADLNEAIKPLVAMILRGKALYAATRNPAIGHFLNDIVVSDPIDLTGIYPLIDHASITVDGERVNMTTASQNDPSAKAIINALQPLIDAQRQIAGHRPFVHPNKRPAPYVLKGRTDGPGMAFGDEPRQSGSSNLFSAR